jgi:hypothetical protein
MSISSKFVYSKCMTSWRNFIARCWVADYLRRHFVLYKINSSYLYVPNFFYFFMCPFIFSISILTTSRKHPAMLKHSIQQWWALSCQSPLPRILFHLQSHQQPHPLAWCHPVANLEFQLRVVQKKFCAQSYILNVAMNLHDSKLQREILNHSCFLVVWRSQISKLQSCNAYGMKWRRH